MRPIPLPKNDTMASSERGERSVSRGAAAARSRSRSRSRSNSRARIINPPANVHVSLKALVDKFDNESVSSKNSRNDHKRPDPIRRGRATNGKLKNHGSRGVPDKIDDLPPLAQKENKPPSDNMSRNNNIPKQVHTTQDAVSVLTMKSPTGKMREQKKKGLRIKKGSKSLSPFKKSKEKIRHPEEEEKMQEDMQMKIQSNSSADDDNLHSNDHVKNYLNEGGNDEIRPLQRRERTLSPHQYSRRDNIDSKENAVKPEQDTSADAASNPSGLMRNVGRALSSFLSPMKMTLDPSNTNDQLLSINKSNSIDESIAKAMSLGSSPSLSAYEGPTKIHRAFLLAPSLNDLYSLVSNARAKKSLSTHLQMVDDHGRNPLHLLGLNKSLAHSLTRTAESYRPHSQQRNRRYLSSSGGTFNGPGNGQRSDLDPEKVTEMVQFVLDLVLPNNASQLLAEDKNGHIPFQEVFVLWIDIVDKSALAWSSNNKSRISNVFKSKVKVIKGLLNKNDTVTELRTAMSGNHDLDDNTIVIETGDRYAMPTTPSLDSGTAGRSGSSDEPKNTNHAFEEISEIELPVRVSYSLHVISGILDVLGELSRRAQYRKHKDNIHYVNIPRVGARLRRSDISSASFSRRQRGKNHEDDDDSSRRSIVSGNLSDVSHNIEVSFASTQNAIKTLLSIDNNYDRHLVMGFSIVRRAMLHKESLGTWLSDLLQDERKAVRKRAIDYLILLSDVLESEAKEFDSSEEMEARLNELYIAVGELDGLIPSMIGIDKKMVEEASTTPLLTKVLDGLVMTPSVAFTLFFDTLLIALCIFCFRKSADGYLLGRDTTSILHWMYAVNALTFYLTLREFCKAIALVTMAKSRKLFLNFSNALNILSLIFLITSVLAIRLSVPLEVEASQNMRILITITTGLLWVRLIGMLKSINVKMATFVMAIVQISKDILWFMVILVVVVLCFAQMFFTLLVPGNCNAESTLQNRLDCEPSEYYLKVYSVLLGDFGLFDREEDFFNARFALVVFVIFTFLIAIVLLNVLIAIISDSYEKCLLRSRHLFGRARVLQLAEIIAIQYLFKDANSDVKGASASESRCNPSRCLSGVRNIKWTKGGSTFSLFSALAFVLWCVAEAYASSNSKAKVDNQLALSFGTIIINIFVFIVFNFFLTRETGKEGIIVNCVQRFMMQFLGRGEEADLSLGNESDDWRGRVNYLSNEMQRLNEEFVGQTREMIDECEGKTLTQMYEIETKMDRFQDDIINQVRQLLDGSLGPECYRTSTFSRSEA